MKIMRKALNHIAEMHPNANLVRAEFKDGVFKAVIHDVFHIDIKAHITDGVLIIEESEVKA